MTSVSAPYWSGEGVSVFHGDCVQTMAGMPDNSIDAIVCDPPYSLSFMGRNWDTHDSPLAFQAWCLTWATEARRVLKPGGFMLAAGGSRTFHRLACAIEDAGFEVRDTITWHFGAGFPKSRNVTKDLESIPPCTCDVSDHVGAVNTALPTSFVGAGERTEPGAVPFAGLAAHSAVGIGAKVVPTGIRSGSHPDVDTVDELRVRETFPMVLGPSTMTGLTEGQQISRVVGGVLGEPKPLGDQVMDGEVSVGTASASPAVAFDDKVADARPHQPAIFPVPATPSGIARSGESTPVGDGHAGPPAVDAVVRPVSELHTTDSADVDPVPFTSSHTTKSTAERISRCRVCGGRRGDVPQGLGTALKPATEFFTLARKPLIGTVAQNVTTHGTGALNIDACRIAGDMSTGTWGAKQDSSIGYGGTEPNGYRTEQNPAGRWPANVVLDPEMAAVLDKQSGATHSQSGGVAGWQDEYVGGTYTPIPRTGYDDSGGASRYFFVADDGPRFRYTAKAPSSERPSQGGIQHATVKPLSLMQFLVRLITPPGGTVLDPFAGSGTTGEAAIREGFSTILIEREADYLPLILERFRRPINYIMDFEGDAS